MYIRKSDQRGRARFGWLDSHHSFSFGHYYDPQHMGWGALRVINDDEVAPGAGFDTHGHRDMEIISYVLQGSIRHRDNMGHESVLKAGEIQRMTAGTGILHSEFNDSRSEALKFLQIWIMPDTQGLEPGYEQRELPQKGALTDLVTPDGRGNSLKIHQDAVIQRLVLDSGEPIKLSTPEKRKGYLHIIRGKLIGNDQNALEGELSTGDAVGLRGGETLSITASRPVEALWFDLCG